MAGKLHMARVDAPVIARDTGPKRITDRIENVEIRGANRARIVLATSTLEDSDAPPERVRLTLMGARAVGAAVPGAFVSTLAVLRPPPEPVLPYGYDFARWAYFQGIGGVGFAFGGAIAAALITGTRAAISEEDTEAYRDSGLAHVLSISRRHARWT